MTTFAFEGSLRAISEEWCRTHLNMDVEGLPEGMTPTGALVLFVMAQDRFTHGDDISAGVRTRLGLNKKWDADIVAAHGLKMLLKEGYVKLAEPGPELKNLDDYRRHWELTEAGKRWLRDASQSSD